MSPWKFEVAALLKIIIKSNYQIWGQCNNKPEVSTECLSTEAHKHDQQHKDGTFIFQILIPVRAVVH